MRWDDHLGSVRARLAGRRDRNELEAGWLVLARELGEEVWAGVLGDFLWNVVPSSLVNNGRLGLLLRDLVGTPGYSKVIERLRGGDEGKARGMLAELGTLWTLRRRHVDAEFRPHLKGADLVAKVERPVEFEVSYLGHASTWQQVELLRARLETRLSALLSRSKKPFFVEIECSGYPGPLLRQVDAACEEFQRRIDDARPWTATLAAGLECTVQDGRIAPQFYIHGATVYGGDIGASECALLRVPAKLEKESPQVAAGGVVLVWTHEMTPLIMQAVGEDSRAFEDHVYAQAIADISNIGERERQVAAFAVLDEIGAEATSHPAVPAPAQLLQAPLALGRQRLLWIPNPHAEVPADPRVLDWIRPVIGFEMEASS